MRRELKSSIRYLLIDSAIVVMVILALELTDKWWLGALFGAPILLCWSKLCFERANPAKIIARGPTDGNAAATQALGGWGEPAASLNPCEGRSFESYNG